MTTLGYHALHAQATLYITCILYFIWEQVTKLSVPCANLQNYLYRHLYLLPGKKTDTGYNINVQ